MIKYFIIIPFITSLFFISFDFQPKSKTQKTLISITLRRVDNQDVYHWGENIELYPTNDLIYQKGYESPEIN